MVLNLEKLEKARGLRTRSAVAKELGITRQQVWHYEKGLSEPPLHVLSKLLDLYGIKFEDVTDEKKLATLSN